MKHVTPVVSLPPIRSLAFNGRVLQRQCACGQHTGGEGECADCKKKKDAGQSSGELVQRRVAQSDTGILAGGDAPSIVHEVLQSSGRALDTQSLAFFGARLTGNFRQVEKPALAGLFVSPSNSEYEKEAENSAKLAVSGPESRSTQFRDFSNVRVHTDARAAESARAVGALAYTVGNNIVFAAGQYSPNTLSGQRLLGHELSHVIQQGNASSGPQRAVRIQRQEGPGSDSDDDKKGSDQQWPKLDDPDSTGISTKFEDGKLVFCASILGHEVCTDTIDKIRDYMKKQGKKGGSLPPSNPKCPKRETPWGGCCPGDEIWDYQEWKCKPFKLDQHKCLPWEKPNLVTGECCKPGDTRVGCLLPTPVVPPIPSNSSQDKGQSGNNPPPGQGQTSGAQPPSNTILHFQLDLPRPDAAQDEGALLGSLVPADQAVWKGLIKGLQTNSGWKFQLVGRASPEGAGDYNFDLALRRAELVRAALLANSVSADRVVDVAPECKAVQRGVYDCGKVGSTGPQDRQVKVVFAPQASTNP